mgnify:CR=1 FL=1
MIELANVVIRGGENVTKNQSFMGNFIYIDKAWAYMDLQVVRLVLRLYASGWDEWWNHFLA